MLFTLMTSRWKKLDKKTIEVLKKDISTCSNTNKTDSYAFIETAVDFEKLETVLVITN